VESCEDIVDLTQCTSDALKTAFPSLKCFWLYENDPSDATDTGWCKSKEDTNIECGDAKRLSQCGMSDVTGLHSNNCFWLYSGSDETGEGGSCKEKNDASLSCGSAQRDSQCPLDGVTNLNLSCFWLFNSSDVGNNGGVCETKTNSSLTCGDVRRRDQCTLADVDKLGENCLWLEGDLLEEAEIQGRCKEKVDRRMLF
jgi:hypothetical protein